MNTTLIIETTGQGIFCECRSCGSSNYSDRAIIHRKRCSTPRAQYSASEVYVGTEAAKTEIAKPVLKTLAADVRRTGLTLGRDEDVYEAVRRGHLSASDAMNSDD